MKRRTIVTTMFFMAAGASGLIGFRAGERFSGAALDPQKFLQMNQGVKFQYISSALLLKLFSRRASDSDRYQMVLELINHNRSLFVLDPYNRTLGMPGFYRIAG